MNKKIRNARHLHSHFHFSFLKFFPILILALGLLFGASLWKARTDLKRIGTSLRRNIEDVGIRRTPIYYRVQFGDNLSVIADRFGVSENTLIWANEDIDMETIRPDMVIQIPPVTGIMHIVKNRETIESISQMYKVDTHAITSYPYNEFSHDTEFPLTPGQLLIVPGGTKTPVSIKDVLGVFIKKVIYR